MNILAGNKLQLRINVATIRDTATLYLGGHFSFRDKSRFELAYRNFLDSPRIENIVVNFAGVAYLDSTALGALLALRHHAQATNTSLFISGADAAVMQKLNYACFSKLFTIN